MNILVVVLYVLAALTDVFDGVLAQKRTKHVDLDGVADMVFLFATLWWLWLLTPSVFSEFLPGLLATLVASVVFLGACIVRRKTLCTPHLWSGKAAMALVVAVLPVTQLFGVLPWFIHLVWVVVVLSRIEATVLVLGRARRGARTVFSR